LTVTHHELCFGCGLANLFGLQLELSPEPDGALAGRFFVKQDHQGPPGFAHGGVMGTALDEAMALVVHHAGIYALTRRLEVDLLAPAPVGSFGHVRAWVASDDGRTLLLESELRGESSDGRLLARAGGVFVRVEG
jgi:acyl-coenzyme A thioesterase PaaI-like protein